jgi:hypothetical protein
MALLCAHIAKPEMSRKFMRASPLDKLGDVSLLSAKGNSRNRFQTLRRKSLTILL